MPRKNRNARQKRIDPISGYCANHENILRYKKMVVKECLHCNAQTGGKCKYLIDRGKELARV